MSSLVNEKPLASLLANRQWWKVCWVYGDQAKFYRQLYGTKKRLASLRNTATPSKSPSESPSTLDDDGQSGEQPDSLPASLSSSVDSSTCCTCTHQ